MSVYGVDNFFVRFHWGCGKKEKRMFRLFLGAGMKLLLLSDISEFQSGLYYSFSAFLPDFDSIMAVAVVVEIQI